MDNLTLIIYIVVMALVTYLIRMLPIVVFRKKINSVFLKSVLFYIPYAVLTAMTIPFMLYANTNILSCIVGLLAAGVMACFKENLLLVASTASLASLIVLLIN